MVCRCHCSAICMSMKRYSPSQGQAPCFLYDRNTQMHFPPCTFQPPPSSTEPALLLLQFLHECREDAQSKPKRYARAQDKRLRQSDEVDN